jgi:hypothetical protein
VNKHFNQDFLSSRFSSDEEDANALDRAHVKSIEVDEHEAIEKNQAARQIE